MKENKAKKLIENSLDSLAQSLDKGQSDAFQSYLAVMSRFHEYSLRNILLIVAQRPEATNLAGFHAWKKFGRFVKKGEKGIAIVAPLIFKKQIDDNDKGDQTDMTVNGFKVVYVFDVSQTEGDELPVPTTVKGEPQEYVVKLYKLITDNDIVLEYIDSSTYEGCSHGGKIVIRKGLSPAKDFSVKIHELAHEFLHHTGEKLSKTQKETEAEAVAFVVSSAIGLDTNSASSDYIQLYKGKKETLMNSIQRIKDVSGRILEGLNI